MLKQLFERFGWIEALSKQIAYSDVISTDKLKNIYHKFFLKKGEVVEHNPQKMLDIFEYISGLGIKKGDILILHSSMEGLRSASPDPKVIIDYLLNLLGPEGTLVVPAFATANRKYSAEKIPTYNPKKSLCWTGMIPNVFLTYPGVVRSSFPYNSLAALGAEAETMMENNLLGDTPHGTHSPWYYCISHHAKILYLGVNVAECNTMLHVVEDYYDEKWPIKDWYAEQKYLIKREDEKIEKTIRVCDAKWIKYNICYHYNGKLKRKKLLSESIVSDIIVGFTPDSKAVFDLMVDEVRKGKIRYRIPKKYWK